MPNGKPNIVVFWGDDIGITNLPCAGGRAAGVAGFEELAEGSAPES